MKTSLTILQQTISRARGPLDDGTCHVPKHVGDLLTFVEHTVCIKLVMQITRE